MRHRIEKKEKKDFLCVSGAGSSIPGSHHLLVFLRKITEKDGQAKSSWYSPLAVIPMHSHSLAYGTDRRRTGSQSHCWGQKQHSSRERRRTTDHTCSSLLSHPCLFLPLPLTLNHDTTVSLCVMRVCCTLE